jgi:hypothetical protein
MAAAPPPLDPIQLAPSHLQIHGQSLGEKLLADGFWKIGEATLRALIAGSEITALALVTVTIGVLAGSTLIAIGIMEEAGIPANDKDIDTALDKVGGPISLSLGALAYAKHGSQTYESGMETGEKIESLLGTIDSAFDMYVTGPTVRNILGAVEAIFDDVNALSGSDASPRSPDSLLQLARNAGIDKSQYQKMQHDSINRIQHLSEQLKMLAANPSLARKVIRQDPTGGDRGDHWIMADPTVGGDSGIHWSSNEAQQLPPANPSTRPPVNPSANPPTHPPFNPPIIPPASPPINQPAIPPAQPPVSPPANSALPQQAKSLARPNEANSMAPNADPPGYDDAASYQATTQEDDDQSTMTETPDQPDIPLNPAP